MQKDYPPTESDINIRHKYSVEDSSRTEIKIPAFRALRPEDYPLYIDFYFTIRKFPEKNAAEIIICYDENNGPNVVINISHTNEAKKIINIRCHSFDHLYIYFGYRPSPPVAISQFKKLLRHELLADHIDPAYFENAIYTGYFFCDGEISDNDKKIAALFI